MSIARQIGSAQWAKQMLSTLASWTVRFQAAWRRHSLEYSLAALMAIASLSLTVYLMTGDANDEVRIAQPAPMPVEVPASTFESQPAPIEAPALALEIPAGPSASPLIDPAADPSADSSAEATVASVPLPKPERHAALVRPTQTRKIPSSTAEAPRSTATATRDRLDELADRFIRFDHALNVAARSRLDTPTEVRRVLKNLRFTNAEDIAQGWYASRAIIAAQHPDFIRGVRDELDTYGEAAVTAKLNGSGSYARNIAGAQSAAASVLNTIVADNRKMADLSKRFLMAAREFQNKKWGSLESLPAQEAAPSSHAAAGDNIQIGAMLADLAATLNELAGVTPAQAYAPSTMERILALGARRVIGTTQRAEDNSAALLTDQQSSKCLRWARLNLNQCLAAAHFPSEEAWCTGKHAIEDVRACWAQALPPRIATARDGY